MFDPFLAVPGTERTLDELNGERYLLALEVSKHPDDAWLLGQLDTVRWAMGETATPPLSRHQDRTRTGFRAEVDLAQAIHLGIHPGDSVRAGGVRVQLRWLLERSSDD